MHHQIELEHRVEISSDPFTVYDLVSDVTRTGERSPECIAARWTQGEPGRVGSQFVGSNYERHPETGQEWRWDMTCEVVRADRPTGFAWSVMTEAWDTDTSVWRYEIAQTADGVLLTHGFRMARPPKGWQPILDHHSMERQLELVEQRRDRLDRGMAATVAAIKAALDRGGDS